MSQVTMRAAGSPKYPRLVRDSDPCQQATAPVDQDPTVVTALAFIQECASHGISVENVLDHLATRSTRAVSRSTLERRFAVHVGHTVKKQIDLVRIDYIQGLLRNTNHPMVVVAEMTGFHSPEQFNKFFKRETTQTPGEWRKRHRAASGPTNLT